METQIDEIADRIFRLSTYIPEIAPPAGFTFNQFVVDADEPLLFHCGPHSMFPLISEAFGKIMPINRLRWITFGHVESDECGAMNDWLAAAPDATVAFNALGCELSVTDMAVRPPRAIADGEVLDLGSRRVRFITTPHVPHNWEAQVVFEEVTGTLLCGDLLGHVDGRAATTDADIVDAALTTEGMFGSMSMGPLTVPTIRRLADLQPNVLGLMHGSSIVGGDTGGQLRRLADAIEQQLAAAVSTT